LKIDKAVISHHDLPISSVVANRASRRSDVATKLLENLKAYLHSLKPDQFGLGTGEKLLPLLG
jgi:hypothetical protein